MPELLVTKAALALSETGLFGYEAINDFDIYNEYKRGFPRLRSSAWISPSCTLVLLADSSYGLQPLVKNVIRPHDDPSNLVFSNQIVDLVSANEVHSLPIPRLPPLFAGLCQRFFDSYDDVAMIAAEQLVDGMDLDEDWCERNLRNASPKVRQLASRLVAEKHLRLDDFSENMVTCFVTAGEAKRLRLIVGYE